MYFYRRKPTAHEPRWRGREGRKGRKVLEGIQVKVEMLIF